MTMLWKQVKENVMWWEEMKFVDIMKKKDIKAGLDYLHRRASTIRQMQIIEMIKTELKGREREKMLYIKAKEVIEKVKEYFCQLIDAGKHEVDVIDSAAELQLVIESVLGIGWISVEDELPEDDASVLVCVNGKYGNMIFENALEIASYYDGEGWELEAYPDFEKPEIDYWMELPDAPEKG